jgi:hypothetical protein
VLRQCISNNPYRDISLLTWCVAVIGWYEYDQKMFWLTVPSFFAVGILRAAVQSPRPFEYDPRSVP